MAGVWGEARREWAKGVSSDGLGSSEVQKWEPAWPLGRERPELPEEVAPWAW